MLSKEENHENRLFFQKVVSYGNKGSVGKTTTAVTLAHGRGVIRDLAVHRLVLTDVLAFAQEIGFAVRGLVRSPLLGPKGKVEFLAWLGVGGPDLENETRRH